MGIPLLAPAFTLSLSLSLSRIDAASGLITPDNRLQESYRVSIFDSPRKNSKENLVIYAIEKLFDITLEDKAISRVVLRDRPRHTLQNSYAFMRAESDATRKRSWHERFFKNWVDDGENCVMQYAVADSRFVDVPLFRIGYVKTGIWTMLIDFVFQISMQLKDVLLKIPFEALNVRFIPFIDLKCIPRRKEIFGRYYCFE